MFQLLQPIGDHIADGDHTLQFAVRQNGHVSEFALGHEPQHRDQCIVRRAGDDVLSHVFGHKLWQGLPRRFGEFADDITLRQDAGQGAVGCGHDEGTDFLIAQYVDCRGNCIAGCHRKHSSALAPKQFGHGRCIALDIALCGLTNALFCFARVAAGGGLIGCGHVVSPVYLSP